ncbi:hypothetical protein Taro_024592 [Colocasia esculenta]|uniref:Uncharacterized protein n=1 Tax=Colocasia esculenta TaxID=4460 RepID=A0A843V7V9_COLES|nr:hypothetical protein [Colocasia esculenta]
MSHHPATNFQITLTGDTSSPEMEKLHEAARGITNHGSLTVPVLRKRAAPYSAASPIAPLSSTTTDEDATTLQSKDMGSLFPACTLHAASSSLPATTVDELNRIVGTVVISHRKKVIEVELSNNAACQGIGI